MQMADPRRPYDRFRQGVALGRQYFEALQDPRKDAEELKGSLRPGDHAQLLGFNFIVGALQLSRR